MAGVANLLVAFVALEHVLVLEMFLWTTPYGMRTFGLTPEFAEASSALAANQGLYNGFLAAGLLWSLLRRQDAFATRAVLISPRSSPRCGRWCGGARGRRARARPLRA
jgi:putative membrane protein